MRYVTYYRVSTTRQGRSGLGLEAQQSAVQNYLRSDDEVIATYTEVESGKNPDRPQLRTALAMCRARRATLLVAKLDRLARNVHFLTTVMNSGVEFICADNPNASTLTIHILGAVAEYEAKVISERTKAALAAAKARGVKMGGWRGHNPTDDQRRKARAKLQQKANKRAEDLEPVFDDMVSRGITTNRAQADELNRLGVLRARGGRWFQGGVFTTKRRLKRRQA